LRDKLNLREGVKQFKDVFKLRGINYQYGRTTIRMLIAILLSKVIAHLLDELIIACSF